MTVLSNTTTSFKTPIGWNPHNGYINTNVNTVVTVDTTNTTVTKLAYMRPIYIRFKGTGFKGYTLVTPYFDGVDVSKWCAPLSEKDYEKYTDVTVDDTEYVEQQQIWKLNTGSKIKADGDGNFWGMFKVPASQFNCGTTVMKFVTQDGYETEQTFTSVGTLKTDYNTINTTVNVKLTDPIAQSFYIDLPDNIQGCYITSVGVYFRSKSDTENLFLEIRNLENGYPGQERLSVSVVKPKDIVVSNNGNSRYETKIKLPKPVYVDNKKGYAFVLRSNSTEYNVWTASVGQNRVDKDETVDRNPYVGMLFRSANNDTWVADQTSDMKFKIYRAKFKKNAKNDNKVSATITSSILPPMTRTAFRTYIETKRDGKNLLRIFATNHGLYVGSKVSVVIFPYTNETDITKMKLGGNEVSISDILFGTSSTRDTSPFTVVACDSISFTIKSKAAKTLYTTESVDSNTTDYTWVQYVKYSPNIHTDIIYLNQANTEFQGTTISNRIYPYYVTEAGNPTSGISDYYDIINNQEMQLDEPVLFPSYDEMTRLETDSRYPAFITTTLESDNDYMSPMIPLEGMSLVTASLLFNNPAKDAVLNGTWELDTSEDAEDMKSQYIAFMEEYERPVEATESLFKYVTQPIELENDSTAIKVIFAANVTKDNYASVFYRTLSVHESCDITEKEWIPMSYEGIYTYASEEDEYYDYEYDAEGLDGFNKFQVKIVGWGDDKTVPVKLKDFRAIALAK